MRKPFCAEFLRACAVVLLLASGSKLAAQTDHQIYTDSLQNGWDNWSWYTTLDLSSTAQVHGGTKAIATTITAGWGAISLHHADMDSSPYESLSFWIHGGPSGGQRLKIYAALGTTAQTEIDIPDLPANTWQQLTFSLTSLGIANKPNFARFSIQDRSGSGSATFYLDDIRLAASSVPPPAITLTSPSDGAIYNVPASVPLGATVVANGHTINKVQFYAGTTLVAEDTASPYSSTWANPAAGSYSLSGRVVYDGSSTRDSAAANIIVVSNMPVTITVDAQADRHAISPLIYGTAFASASQMSDLNFAINRSGGNAETRYNWQLNAHNRGGDWYFESIGDNPATPGASTDDHISSTKSVGAEAAITIPMVGWMPKLGPGRGKLASYSIAKYGPQTGNDSLWMPDAGNGISVTNNTPITWNDPNEANFLTNSSFQQAFVQHLTNRWGLSTNGGVRYYLMDNEWSIWHSTHRDIHPNGASRREVRDLFFEYAGKVKATDPNALVLGPEEFGWSGYLNSGADLQYGGQHGWSYLPDRSTNGNLDYVAWFLDQCRQRDTAAGQRLLDYFTLHRYPEGAERNDNGNDVSTGTQLLRNRSTRSFWDPGYVDESWINTPVQLIPRMKQWVASYYPGTKIGITEYNWNAESHINGATAQADMLGIFGREGLDLATRWTTPDPSTPTYKAMKLYRNYDGNKSTFGDTSVSAGGPNPDQVAVFAGARSSDGALTLVVINKQLGAQAWPTIRVNNFVPTGTAQLWQLTSANTITRLADLTFTGNTLSNSLPAQSITMYVIPAAISPASNPTPANGAANIAIPTNLSWLAGSNAASHRVFFGVSSNAVFAASTNSSEFLGAFSSASCAVPGANASARYHWRVDEVSGGASAMGPVWTFSTAADPSAAMTISGNSVSASNFTVSFPTLLGQRYRLERNDTLNPGTWTPIADQVAGTGYPLQIVDPDPSASQRFYRVVILAP